MNDYPRHYDIHGRRIRDKTPVPAPDLCASKVAWLRELAALMRQNSPLASAADGVDEAAAEIEQLRAFVAVLFDESDWPDGGDIDGFAFQEEAVKAGILTPETRTEPCSDICQCQEFHGDISGGVTCYRKTQWLIDAARKGKP